MGVEKEGYDHFMLKEIFEQPQGFQRTMADRIEGGRVHFPELGFNGEQINKWNKVFIVACGTAYHSGLFGKPLLEEFLQIPVEVEIASEFRYRKPLVDKKTLAIFISQSGETADTLGAMRLAKAQGAAVLAIVNTEDSTIAKEADYSIPLRVGGEIAVASTKAYTAMVIIQYLFSIYLAQLKETIPPKRAHDLLHSLQELPLKAQGLLEQKDVYLRIAQHLQETNHIFYIGRGLDYFTAQEGALKLKETSYIYAIPFPAGELKHGTMALVTDKSQFVALALQDKTFEKMLNNLKELHHRGSQIIALANEGDEEISRIAAEVIFIPRIENILSPILAVIPLQFLAYYTAVLKGCNVDQPRNLTKAVTAE